MKKYFTLVFFFFFLFDARSQFRSRDIPLIVSLGYNVILRDTVSLRDGPFNPLESDSLLRLTGFRLSEWKERQAKKKPETPASSTQRPTPYHMACMRSITGDEKPLVLINWKTYDTSQGLIDSKDIQYIEIVNPDMAEAMFGKDGVEGAVLITLKKETHQRFIVLDSITGEPLYGATVAFINGNDTVWYAAGEDGIISVSNLRKDYQLTSSYIGYTTKSETIYVANPGLSIIPIRLARNITMLKEAVVTNSWGCGRRYEVIGYYSKTHKHENDSVSLRSPSVIQQIRSSPEFSIYPNPARAGSVIHVSRLKTDKPVLSYSIADINGREIVRKLLQPSGKTGIVSVQTNPSWPAGVYFINLWCENGTLAASGKIVIQ